MKGWKSEINIRTRSHWLTISFQIYGYINDANPNNRLMKAENEPQAITIGANLFGVAACLAFLRMIFVFELHHRIGPILFCMKNVFWDILSIMGSYFIIMLAFSVGLVSIFGFYDESRNPHFHNFESTLKRLFWIMFDPGQDEYTNIEPLKAVQLNDKTKNVETNITHNIGIYIWGFYQV